MSTSYVNPGWSVNESDCGTDYSAKPKNNLFDVLLNAIKLVLKALIGIAAMVPITYMWCLMADYYPGIPFCVFTIPVLLSVLVVSSLLVSDFCSKFNIWLNEKIKRYTVGCCELFPWICFAPFGIMIASATFDSFSGGENNWFYVIMVAVAFLIPIAATAKWRKNKPFLYALIVLESGPCIAVTTTAASLLLVTLLGIVLLYFFIKYLLGPLVYLLFKAI